MSERRKFPRVEVGTEIRVEGPTATVIAQLKDMSLGGAAFFVKHPIGKPGDTIEIEIPHPAAGPLPLSGEIIRITETTKGQTIAMKFFRAANESLHKNRKRMLELEESAEEGRRKHPRIASRIMVKYNTPSELTAILENISMGGFALTVDARLDDDGEIDVEIPHPKTGRILSLIGKVVHQQSLKVDDQIRYRVGFEFKYLTSEQRDEISDLLDELIRSSDIVSSVIS